MPATFAPRRPAAWNLSITSLRPSPPSPRSLLDQAAAAPSLFEYVANLRWMNPLYAPLRNALASNNYSTPRERGLLQLNLERARALPAGAGRFVLVNAAAQKLFMYENGQPVDSMRVVIGKPKHATPMMAALIRFASLNPYWNVPPDLAAERIAPGVLKEGIRYLDRARLPGAVELGGGRPGHRSVDGRLAGGRRRPRRSAGAPAARPRQCDGADEVHVPQSVRRLPPRHARKGAAERGLAPVQRRLRPARGCAAARPLAVRPAARAPNRTRPSCR